MQSKGKVIFPLPTDTTHKQESTHFSKLLKISALALLPLLCHTHYQWLTVGTNMEKSVLKKSTKEHLSNHHC